MKFTAGVNLVALDGSEMGDWLVSFEVLVDFDIGQVRSRHVGSYTRG